MNVGQIVTPVEKIIHMNEMARNTEEGKKVGKKGQFTDSVDTGMNYHSSWMQ